MNIPDEILEKYHMDNLEHYTEGYGEKEGTAAFCRAFLKLTDHISNKLVEGSIRTEECVDELACRELARQELAKLNGEEAGEPTERKTLEERITEAEAGMESVVNYDEMQVAIMEGVNEV